MAERLAADVVVVGAGPAGLAAAVHAAEAGARVAVLDESPRAGGQVWRTGGPPATPAAAWLGRLARAGGSLVAGASVVDAPAPGELLLDRGGAALRVAWRRLVLATGARELFLPFPGWTLPGVLGAGAAQAIAKAGASFAGMRVVVAGTGPLLLPVAASLRASGATIVGIVEQAPLARLAAFGAGLAGRPGKLVEALGLGARLAGVRYRAGSWARAAGGDGRVERVVVADGRREREWPCDVLACGFGLVANLELPRLLGCAVAENCVVVDGDQHTSCNGVFAAGELTAIGGLGHALATGAIAGLAAVGRPAPTRLLRARAREEAFAARLARAFALRPELGALASSDTVVCRCEDVTLAAIDGLASEAAGRAAVAGGLDARAAKLHTRAGMGACQGRVCGPALGFLRGATGLTIRPPLVPAPLSVLADGAPGAPVEEEQP